MLSRVRCFRAASSLSGMYVPASNAITDEAQIRAFVKEVGVAELVTVGPDGYPRSTLLPIVWRDDRVVAHFARANKHWQDIDNGAATLLIVRGDHGYVSPSWYPGKRDHGRVVPTWNYSAVQLRGTSRTFCEAEALLEAVNMLTNHHESGRDEPWAVDDAPAEFIDGMLRAIVGIEVKIEQINAKAKLSQNRSAEDRSGVVRGLRAENGYRGEHRLANQMETELDL